MAMLYYCLKLVYLLLLSLSETRVFQVGRNTNGVMFSSITPLLFLATWINHVPYNGKIFLIYLDIFTYTIFCFLVGVICFTLSARDGLSFKFRDAG